jgi:glycosyltransferase involved in cell wall biosynthesis
VHERLRDGQDAATSTSITSASREAERRSTTPSSSDCLYEKRQKFLQENKLDLKIGNVLVQDLDGVNLPKTNELYAQTLRESRVLVNLPSLCSHVVTKVTEAMACGTAVVTPVITQGKEAENFKLFENGKHLQYYEKNPKGMIDSLLNEPEYREEMARRGCEEVHKNHRLELRCATLLQNL